VVLPADQPPRIFARAGPSTEQESLGPGWNHVHWSRVVKATIPTPAEPSLESVTAARDQNKVTVSKKAGAAANPALKTRRTSGRPK
jgi:hypothetical protein